MCIRDRVRYADDLVILCQSEARAQEALRLLGREVERRGLHCLLYTSDAADERSSVDLGGRRIIKKKITVYTN